MKDQLYLLSRGHIEALMIGGSGRVRPEGVGLEEGAGRRVCIGPRYEPSMHWPFPVLLG